jgi:DNA-binding GntR family transcriptional regulator
MKTLVVRTLSEQLVDVVRERIVSGAVSVDQAIRQDALAAELGVSKIPLREALARLEQEGLLRSHANRGFFVRPLTSDEAEEVYMLRLQLEPATTALAARRASDEEREHAAKSFATLHDAIVAHDENVAALNRSFHLALLKPSHHPITTGILERLHVLGDRYVHKHLEPFGRNERANEEHRDILDAWLEGDAKRVAALIKMHINQTLEDLRRQLGGAGA